MDTLSKEKDLEDLLFTVTIYTEFGVLREVAFPGREELAPQHSTAFGWNTFTARGGALISDVEHYPTTGLALFGAGAGI